MGPPCSYEFRNSGQYCSLSEIVNRLQGFAGPGTKVTPVRRQSMANLFDQTPEERRPVWMPVPPVFEQKPKPNDDDAEGCGPPPQIQNRPLRF
jgi:hypothetical protein